MKHFFYIIILSIFLSACLDTGPDKNPYSSYTRTLTVCPEYPSDFPAEDKSLVTLTITDRNKSTTYTCKADENGNFKTSLPDGSYRLSISYKYNGKVLGGLIDRVILSGKDNSISLELSISVSGNIVFKELYFGGCTKYPLQGTYQSDSYVILHNNSSEIQYLDSLCFGTCDPYRSIATNVWDNTDYAHAAQAIWQIGGDGSSFPLNPGEDAVIVVYGAINHQSMYPQSVDLNKSDYFVCYNSSFFSNTNYHPTPGNNIKQDHILNVVIKIGKANAFTFSLSSPASIIFKAPYGTTIQDYIQQEGSVIQKPGFADKIVLVPNEWIIDGVEVFEKSGKNSKRLDSKIDASAIEFSSPHYGHTVYRKTDENSSALYGFEVLQDTNNSADDMYEREIQSLHN